ncbi:DUF3592 domain-containing protein [Alloiococcus sp. CFN-8]|uniref:DUF3592 domain-containing protein n=1 Tax=Alloiococcus sp. CFN-8 TaxID=3416081 RepID=UPI003CF0936A
MKINLLFFIIFFVVGLILLLISLIFKYKDSTTIKSCNKAVKGKVVKYTTWNNNGVSFPIVEYVVNNVSYTQRLKYGWIYSKSSSLKNVNTDINNNVEDTNLRISRNAHIATNPLMDKFPIGSELDVYYNPENPKKSYVLRFVKSPMIKILLLTAVIFIIVAFIGLAFLPSN